MIQNPENFIFASWGDGVFFDRWMLVHFVAGLIIGYILRFTGISYKTALFIALILVAFWELIEVYFSIFEYSANSIIDIIIGIIAFNIAFLIISSIGKKGDIFILAGLVITLVVLEFFGWYAWKENGGNNADKKVKVSEAIQRIKKA